MALSVELGIEMGVSVTPARFPSHTPLAFASFVTQSTNIALRDATSVPRVAPRHAMIASVRRITRRVKGPGEATSFCQCTVSKLLSRSWPFPGFSLFVVLFHVLLVDIPAVLIWFRTSPPRRQHFIPRYFFHFVSSCVLELLTSVTHLTRNTFFPILQQATPLLAVLSIRRLNR